ncbi:uncharacterized protein KY384_006219 [Bacidia gigantensis]|uniref:uncharacterized protein n=1 Tax=Bacidia gigantensis TaxID=2732470 RepID=UPI001D0417E3|nr:uncharacterized protein KY384_006219 [Bacidia gigantensis]KAG8529582.1 hypothetical protein KY384_006219 [Bacidia gigantensis]
MDFISSTTMNHVANETRLSQAYLFEHVIKGLRGDGQYVMPSQDTIVEAMMVVCSGKVDKSALWDEAWTGGAKTQRKMDEEQVPRLIDEAYEKGAKEQHDKDLALMNENFKEYDDKIQTLRDQVKANESTIDSQKSEITCLQTQNGNLRNFVNQERVEKELILERVKNQEQNETEHLALSYKVAQNNQTFNREIRKRQERERECTIRAFKQYNEFWQQKVAALNEQIDSHICDHEPCERKVLSLIDQISNHTCDHQSCEQKVSSLTAQINNHTCDHEPCRQEVLSLNNQINNHNCDHDACIKCCDNLSNQLAAEQCTRNDQAQEEQRLQAEISRLHAEINELSKSAGRIKENRKTMNQHVKEELDALQNVEFENKRLQGNNLQLCQELREAKEEIEHLRTQTEAYVKQLVSQIKTDDMIEQMSGMKT